MRVAAVPWGLARLLVVVGYLMARALEGSVLNGEEVSQLDRGLLAWDASWYRDIAEGGYGAVPESGLRFFPLLPVLARAVSLPLPGGAGVGLILVVNALALVAGVLVHRVAVRETGDRAVARRSAWLVALLPPASVLVWGYSESLMVAAAAGAFLALRSRRWWVAAAAGLLVGLSRPVGVVLVAAAAIEAGRGLRAAPAGERIGRLAAVLSPVAGAGGYLLWVEDRFGSWRLPLEVQESADLRGSLISVPHVVWDALVELASGALWGPALHLPWIALFGWLLIVVARRLPASYAAFCAVVLLVAVTGETLGSFERYALSAFPLLIALAMVTARPWAERTVLVASGAGLVAFSAMTWLEVFVP